MGFSSLNESFSLNLFLFKNHITVIRREYTPFRGLPLNGFIRTPATLTEYKCIYHWGSISYLLSLGAQLFNTMVGPELFNTMVGTQLQLSASMAENPTVCLHGPKSTPNWLFSKSSNSHDHRFRAWRHSHSSPISYVGFIMTMLIVISFACEHKLYPLLCTSTKNGIVQSPTKLNDKI